jgi:hypothetical protein
VFVSPQKAKRKTIAALAAFGLAAAGFALTTSAASADPITIESGAQESDLVYPIDPDATPETVALFQNMYYMAGNYWMYGKQDDMVTGYTGGIATVARTSGVAATATAVTGLQITHEDMSATKQAWGEHAAVQGLDVGYLELKGEFSQYGAMDAASLDGRPGKYPSNGRGPYYGYDGMNIDGARWDDMVQFAAESYQHGSIVTISWHETNPVTYGGYSANLYQEGMWAGHDGTAAEMVLPGGELHNRYIARLDALIAFNEEVTAANGGTPVPILWRPYHEHSGDWFWWGVDDMERKFQPISYDQFAELYKMSQAYLMEHGVHNFLYEISPDRSRLGEPSWLYNDLGTTGVRSLLDKYIDTKNWSSAVKTTAHQDLADAYAEVTGAGWSPSSPHWNEPVALNNSGVPLDLDPVTGARTTADTQFREWIDNGRWKTFFLNKWKQGFPGKEFVDVYGIDNYWESGGLNGHSYHPYNGQQAKILELFCSSFDYVAEMARADGKLVAMTEGSSAIQEIHDRFANQCTTGTGSNPVTLEEGAYPNLKYVSYALTWRGGQSAGSGNANPVTGDYADEIVMAGEVNFYEAPHYFQEQGDIDVDIELPEFPGGLGLEFSSNSLDLGEVSLSSDKAFWLGAGSLPQIAVEDTRPGASVGWDATIVAGDTVTGPVTLDGKVFGIAPQVIAAAEGQTVTAGPGAAAWSEGFKTPGVLLATSPAGASRGVAQVGGAVSFKAPATTPAGAFRGVFSVTVL